MRRRSAFAPLVACLALVAFLPLLAACGGGGGSSKGATRTATDGKVDVNAFDIHFDVKTIKASPGALTVTLVEKGALEHTFKINGTNLQLKVNSGTPQDTGTVQLKQGTYTFECTVPGHAAQGMKGTVVVG